MPFTLYNPRYVAYAHANGRTPDDMLTYDYEQYPGGCMTGFILWISSRSTEFWKEHPEAFLGDTIVDHNAWDTFLGVRKD